MHLFYGRPWSGEPCKLVLNRLFGLYRPNNLFIMGFHGRPWFYDHGRVGEGYILPPLTVSFALHNFYEIKSHHHIKSCLYLSLTKYSSIASPTLSTLEAPESMIQSACIRLVLLLKVLLILGTHLVQITEHKIHLSFFTR